MSGNFSEDLTGNQPSCLYNFSSLLFFRTDLSGEIGEGDLPSSSHLSDGKSCNKSLQVTAMTSENGGLTYGK